MTRVICVRTNVTSKKDGPCEMGVSRRVSKRVWKVETSL